MNGFPQTNGAFKDELGHMAGGDRNSHLFFTTSRENPYALVPFTVESLRGDGGFMQISRLEGDKWSERTARIGFPILVEYAQKYRREITYGEWKDW